MRLSLAIPLAVFFASQAGAGDGALPGSHLPEYRAQEPRAESVTAETLLSNERFWPYQVALTKARPASAGGPALPVGSLGVLIRVEEGGQARLDFGRDGLREIPVGDTDLVERSNLVRRGELEKIAANFVLAIGPRLVDSSAPVMHALSLETAAEKPGFVCVFADPSAESFSEIAKKLAPLAERHGVTTILFPQGRLSDAALREKLRSLEWTVPFLFDHLSEAYTRTLLPSGLKPPAVILLTKEGRVLFESAWREDPVPELTTALDAAFGGKPATAAAAH